MKMSQDEGSEEVTQVAIALQRANARARLDMFASAALKGLMAHHGRCVDPETLAGAAFKVGMAMMKERRKWQDHGSNLDR